MRKLIIAATVAVSSVAVAVPAFAGHAGTCPASWDRVLVDGNAHLADYDTNGDGWVCTTDVSGSDSAPEHRHKDNNGPKNQAEQPGGPLN